MAIQAKAIDVVYSDCWYWASVYLFWCKQTNSINGSDHVVDIEKEYPLEHTHLSYKMKSQAVWQDDGIKGSQIFPKVYQNVETAVST